MYKTVVFILIMLAFDVSSQTKNGYLFRFGANNSPFPHALRGEGYVYKEKKFSAVDHYQDSTVLVYIPTAYKKAEATDIVVYFHGWYNSIDTACVQFSLIEQIENSGINALFIFPEGPKFAPDSFGGKLEEKGIFSQLIREVMDTLHSRDLVSNTNIGNISLAGHSGAYQVIAYILLKGGLTGSIQNVFLFDALYGHTEKYVHWIQGGRKKFVAIYTNSGGTLNTTNNMIDFLSAIDTPILKIEDDNFTTEILTEASIIFIHSKLGHNDVITKHQQFRKFLESIKR